MSNVVPIQETIPEKVFLGCLGDFAIVNAELEGAVHLFRRPGMMRYFKLDVARGARHHRPVGGKRCLGSVRHVRLELRVRQQIVNVLLRGVRINVGRLDGGNARLKRVGCAPGALKVGGGTR